METKRADPYDPSPRSGYLQWDDYFMALAFLSAQRSKDPNKQVGAVIVDSNKVILSIGYNGFPRGCPDQALPWAKLAPAGTNNNPLATKYPYVVHAEANALLNKNTASISGASIYVTMFPCNECAKLLIQAGITEVIYHEEKVQEKVAGEAPGVTGQAPPQSRRTSDSGLLHNGSSQQGAEEVGDADADDANTGGMVRHSAAASNRHGKAQSNGTGCHNPEHSCRPGHELDNATADACYVASKRLLHMAGVRLRQHKLQRNVLLGPWSM